MAKLFLDSTDDAVVSITGNNFTVFGYAGKTVSVAAGVTGLNIKSSVEAVKFSGNVSDYTFLQTGTSVVVKNAAGVVVSTVAVQSDADGSSLAFANGTYAVKTVAPATAGALSTITFGGATINNADAATNNTAAAAPATATAVAGTTVVNALPVLTVPTTPASVIIGNTTDTVTGISFTDTDDNTGFTVTLKATGTSALTATTATGAALKNASGVSVISDEPSNTLVVTGSKDAVNSVIGSLKYITNASAATTEAVTVTVTDAKGGSATSTAPITVVKQLTLATSTPTVSLTGTANDDNIKGTFAQFNTYSTVSVIGGGGTDKLVLSAVTGALTGASTGITVLDLTADIGASQASTTASFDASKFGTQLNTVNFTAGYTTGSTAGDANDTLTATKANAGTTFNIQKTAGALTVSDIYGTAGSSDAFTVNLAGGVTLSGITGSTIIDILNINSNGSAANAISSGGISLTASNNPKIVIGGSQQLTLGTIPDLGTTGTLDATNATGKISLTTAAADSANITGGAGADTLTGAAGSDTISGGAGDDVIDGSTGQNSISGNAGNDSLSGGSASDTINGGDGADTISGGGASDTLNGDAGNDSITGGTGNDTINGGADNDTINGGGGTDVLVGGAGNDSITGGTGADTITGGAGADTLTGGTGIDTFIFTVGDSLSSSYDTITDLGKGDILKIGDWGISGLTSGSAIASSATSATTKEIYMDATNKFLVIETTADGSTVEKIAIQGASSNAPFIYNNNGTASDLTDDYLTVGAVPVSFTNAAGLLTLSGEAGAALGVAVGLAAPTVASQAIGSGSVTKVDASLQTAYGINQTVSTTINSALTLTGSDLADTLAGSDGNDTIIGSAGTDSITGGAGNDSINGGDDVDTITGGTGNDTILGGAGSDIIAGGAGTDSIVAGSGGDTVSGGEGNDTIDLTASSDIDVVWLGNDGVTSSASLAAITSSTDNVDTITGFSIGSAGDVLAFGSTFTGGAFTSGSFASTTSGSFTSGASATFNNKIVDITGSDASYGVESYVVSKFASTFASGTSDKTILLLDNGTSEYVWYINDSLDGTNTDVSAADVVLIGVINTTGSAWDASNFGTALT